MTYTSDKRKAIIELVALVLSMSLQFVSVP